MMMAGTYTYHDSDTDSDTDFGCGWSSGSQKKAVSSWREVYKKQRCEYTGTVTELLKSALKQIEENKIDSVAEWLILPSTHEYYVFQKNSNPNSRVVEGRTLISLIQHMNGRNRERFRGYETSGDVFTVHLRSICPLTEIDSEELLSSVLKIIENSEKNLCGKNLNPPPRRTCTIS